MAFFVGTRRHPDVSVFPMMSGSPFLRFYFTSVGVGQICMGGMESVFDGVRKRVSSRLFHNVWMELEMPTLYVVLRVLGVHIAGRKEL